MKKQWREWLVGGISLLIIPVMLGHFIYMNIIVPRPYEAELKACLKHARALPSEREIADARDVCFRTYPHFL